MDPSEFTGQFLRRTPFTGINKTLPWASPEEISWFDRKKFERGRAYVREYFAPLALGGFLGFLFSPGFKCIGRVFHDLGDFTPRSNFFVRRIPFISYFGLNFWFGNIFEKQGSAGKCGRVTRYSHMRASGNGLPKADFPSDLEIQEEYHLLAKLLRSTASKMDTSGLVDNALDRDADPFSALYFNVTHFASYGLIWLYPTVSNSLRPEVKEDITYAFAVVGRLMPGLRDEDNLALYPNEEIYRKFTAATWGRMISQIDPASTKFIYESLLQAQRYSLGILNAKALLVMFLRANGVRETKKFEDTLSKFQLFTLEFYETSFVLYMKYWIFRTLVNIVFHYVFGTLLILAYKLKRFL